MPGELIGHPMFERATFLAQAQDVGDICVLAVHHLGAHAQFRTTDEPRCYYALQRT
ncbi:MAG: hypothetical protein ABIR54_16715 [Burkholderiaceae bacterium]|jgi:hypothetical protein